MSRHKVSAIGHGFTDTAGFIQQLAKEGHFDYLPNFYQQVFTQGASVTHPNAYFSPTPRFRGKVTQI